MGNRYTIKDFIIELPDRANKVYIVGADSYLGGALRKYWLETGATVYGCGMAETLSECLSKVNYSATDYKSWNFTASSYGWIVFCHDPR